MHGNFTWIDLSTFDVAEAKTFYKKVFQWDFAEEGNGYVNCSRSDSPGAGLYEMPEFFQKIRMPSFWMTYISVTDIDSVVAKAKDLGGKVELEETNALGKVALIRDPAGAGFTCYEGDTKSSRSSMTAPGQWYWSELFVSDLSSVNEFYSGLFGWIFEADEKKSGRFAILNNGKKIGSVQVADNSVKGEKEFWGVFFGVRSIDQFKSDLQDSGGRIIYEHQNTNGRHYLANDSQGAAFFVTAADVTSSVSPHDVNDSDVGNSLKWRSLIGLVIVFLAVLLEADWLWGLLFLFWVIPDLKSGTTYFMEPLCRRQNPFLYWTVIITWLVLSAYLLLV